MAKAKPVLRYETANRGEDKRFTLVHAGKSYLLGVWHEHPEDMLRAVSDTLHVLGIDFTLEKVHHDEDATLEKP